MTSWDDCMWRERVMLAASGEEADTVELRDHLAQCERCRRLYADLRRLERVRVPMARLPEEAHRRVLMAAKEEASARMPERGRALSWLRWVPRSAPRLAWAAVFVVAIGIGVWHFVRPQPQPVPLLTDELNYGLAAVEMDLGTLESEIELSLLDTT